MLIDKTKACLLISCMQKEFLPTLHHSQHLVDSCCWLIDLMNRLSLPTLILNHTNLGEPLACFLKKNITHSTEMTTFSCLDHQGTKKLMEATGKTQFLLAGAETHIAILHTAFALKNAQMQPFVVTDACSTRQKHDHKAALGRLAAHGIACITKEMVFFELLRRSDHSDYMDLSLAFLDQRYLRL